jgi:hypothetical protein
MKNKKGSHVGVVLSFVIFVTFLVFLFSIFGSPIKLPSNKDALIDHIEIEFTNKFSSNLTILTISPAPGETCLKIENDQLFLPILNAIVKNKDWDIVNSKSNQNNKNLIFEKTSDEDFFRIYYSEEDFDDFSEGVPGNCQEILNEGEINFFRENQYFNINKIDEFFSQYESNYSKLKSDFNFPMNNDFSLSFVDSEKNVINETEQRDITTNIYSREIPVQYFDELANINSGFINIKVW